MEREAAVERVMSIVDAIESEPMPVPIREVWVFGDLALGLDPVDRVDVYLAKDMLYTVDTETPDIPESIATIAGVGETVSATWAATHPELVRTNDAGYAAPERCLAATLVGRDEPIHLEICNAGFEDNVTQRVRGAANRDAYEEILDPRGVCLWMKGVRSEEAPTRLREGTYVFPTLPEALEMIGMEADAATVAAKTVTAWRAQQHGATVRGDVL